MLSLRCSSLPLFFRCPQSIRGTVNVSEWNPESDLGRAAHEYARRYVLGQPLDCSSIARLHGADRADLEFLAHRVRQAWREIEATWKGMGYTVASEVELETNVPHTANVTGTADVVVRLDQAEALLPEKFEVNVDVTDWKSGRRDSDYRDQLLGYCVLALENYPAAARATGRVVWLRDLEQEVYTLHRAELPAWKERLALQAKDETYRPGDHCRRCPRQFDCAARSAMQQSSLVALGSPSRQLALLQPEQQIALYHAAKDVAALAERVQEEVRALVSQQGAIRGGGLRLELVPEPRRKLDALAAWPVLTKYLDDEGLSEAVSVSITKAEAAAARLAPEGKGAATKRAMGEELEAANAVTVNTIERLVERREV